MKLKLRTQSTETLKLCFSQISNLRKFVVLRFSPEQLLAILVKDTSLSQEPQVWCKFKMLAIFNEIEIQSLRNDVVLLEINIDLFLQTLKNFEKADSHDLSIRLQRKEASADGTTSGGARTASLALYYSDTTSSANIVNHTFRIPVKILKGSTDILQEPEIPKVDLMMRLPNEFSSTYKRLDKFRKNLASDLVTIKASRRRGGYLDFVLHEEGKFRVTIRWNEKLEVQKPKRSDLDTDSLRAQALGAADDSGDENEEEEDTEIVVKLRDWKMASRIVSTCKTVIFLMCHKEACVLHCLLDDSDDVEILYYLSGVKTREIED